MSTEDDFASFNLMASQDQSLGTCAGADATAGHTPGPWLLEDDDWGHRICMGDAITSPYDHETHNLIKYEHGCFPDECPEQYAQALANARLIAAAPDLLAALKGLYSRYILAIGNEGPEAAAARLAIAKATPADAREHSSPPQVDGARSRDTHK